MRVTSYVAHLRRLQNLHRGHDRSRDHHPAFAEAITRITCDIADCTARTSRHCLGHINTITTLVEQARTIRCCLTTGDITTGETTA